MTAVLWGVRSHKNVIFMVKNMGSFIHFVLDQFLFTYCCVLLFFACCLFVLSLVRLCLDTPRKENVCSLVPIFYFVCFGHTKKNEEGQSPQNEEPEELSSNSSQYIHVVEQEEGHSRGATSHLTGHGGIQKRYLDVQNERK